MYHVELRQFPHNFCRFNLTETELHEAVLDAWARGEWIEFGERKWNPQQAKLIVLEGPQIPLEQLSMGRGWRIAEREGKDVTEQLVAAAHSSSVSASASVAANEQARSQTAATLGLDPAAASLAVELLGLLGEDPVPLMRAWQLALEGHPDRAPSECLALAEGLVRG
ncbi:MAG TPA: hypothetical protein VGP18_06190 [Solirubrobacteraceae bacterium]|jgi:hypothetical protein|nr:hypothetical protein [Solirubrobacteraceae bacterium]